MNKKLSFLLIAGAVVFIVVLGVYTWKSAQVYAPESESLTQIQETQEPALESNATTIVYTNEGFSPSSVTVQKGTAVTFVNESQRGFWPATALHPTHEIYPDKESNCGTSAFDACKPFAPGTSWTFTFNEIGTWRYHDHISASYTGTIIVE